MARAKSKSEASSAEVASLDIDGREVQFTRLSKVLYPESKFTKAQVIDYYVRVAPFILPHLMDRPVTLKRYPDGVKGEAFWDKDAPSFTPPWVKTFPVPRRAGGPDINYILINDRATLAWVANIAALELHPFLHRVPEVAQPTSVVFDLDPGPPADIFTCIEVARLLRAALDGLGLQNWTKVSGSKGLQLYVPLNTPTSYEVTQPFARSLAQLIEKQRPELATSDMSKQKRVGKVFIDWSQNADHKTTVGVYSLRAKRERPFVSMPVEWDELQRALNKRNSDALFFEPPTALERLNQVGDLFAPVLKLKQTLPADLVRSIEQQNKREGRSRKSLREYERKRDFGATAEPPPVPQRSAQGSKRRFVIQKHAASHLHYDFRLEIGGNLKSWAVPKGVPYEPGVRRLASATEDHPIEYLDFEGVIPQGQYGGGTVMVWDIGTFEVVEGNYWKGMLHISLAGKKLRGEWLLKKDAHKGNNAWVLEKAGEAAQPISLQTEEVSALTGRSMAEIANARDAEWQSNRSAPQGKVARAPAKRELGSHSINLDSLPPAEAKFIEPMQCKLVERLPEGPKWLYEAKFDGYRALAIKTDRVKLQSRNNNPLSKEFPSIVEALSPLPSDTVIDGEIVALDPHGRPAFNLLQNRSRKAGAIQFFAFDLLTYCGRSLLSVPLKHRRELLASILSSVSEPVKFSAALEADAATLVAAAREFGLEGIIAKRTDSAYEAGKRSGLWVKLKVNQDQELVIGGYIPAPKRHFDSLLAGYYDQNGNLIFAGKIRNGFSAPGSKERVFERFHGLGTKKCPFANLPEPASARRGIAVTADAMKLCCWLKPTLIAQVGIREWTPEGHLRHSTFLGLRDDKDAREVVRENDAEH